MEEDPRPKYFLDKFEQAASAAKRATLHNSIAALLNAAVCGNNVRCYLFHSPHWVADWMLLLGVGVSAFCFETSFRHARFHYGCLRELRAFIQRLKSATCPKP